MHFSFYFESIKQILLTITKSAHLWYWIKLLLLVPILKKEDLDYWIPPVSEKNMDMN